MFAQFCFVLFLSQQVRVFWLLNLILCASPHTAREENSFLERKRIYRVIAKESMASAESLCRKKRLSFPFWTLLSLQHVRAPLSLLLPACMLNHFSHALLFVTLWTVAHQAPLSKDSPGKNTGVGCHALLQGYLLDPGMETASHVSCIGRWVLYHQCHLGSPKAGFLTLFN